METSNVESFARGFLALGPPLLLLAGTGATVLVALMATGERRWFTLFLGPLVTLGVAVMATVFVLGVLRPAEGSGFLLGGAALALYFMAMGPYYLVLMVVRARSGSGDAAIGRGPGGREGPRGA
jgi:hypothetical protein